ncbi:hypothetical protein ACHAQH_002096 [Verticillium albo-atrum]
MLRQLAFLSTAASAVATVLRFSPSILPGLPYDPLPAVRVPTKGYWVEKAELEGRQVCYVQPDSNGGDDAPAILGAFNDKCRRKSVIILPGPLYHINTPMNTTDLEDVVIEQYGRLLWSDDLDYWLSVSMPINFQNQSTVWNFGGDRVVWQGHGVGTMDGNGQVWYDWARGRGNLAHRPMNINIKGLHDSVLKGLRFVQSQMWTMTIQHSSHLLLEDIYVNSTSSSEHNTLNTDGADTMYSDDITFRRWRVTNGDDAIALKANSTNISVYDSEFWHSTGIAVGSMGQFLGEHEHFENFHVRNVTMHNVIRACYFKTWTGRQIGYPPNGGGGGTGHARNVVLEDITLDGTRATPLHIWQCESYNGHAGHECDTSRFKISDVVWRRFKGTAGADIDRAGWFKCSAGAGGCSNVTVEDWDVRAEGKDELLDKWYCDNMNAHVGFECEEDNKATEDVQVPLITDVWTQADL